MTTTGIVKVRYTNREGQRREWWFRQDPHQPPRSNVTLALDPPVTLCADPTAEARARVDRAEQNGWTDVTIDTGE